MQTKATVEGAHSIPIIRDQTKIIKKSRKKVRNISDRINAQKGTKFKSIKHLFNLLMQPLYALMRPSILKSLNEMAQMPADTQLPYYQLIPLTDKSIVIDETCNGCGTCVKVCPSINIEIKDKKPTFKHSCEMCFACDEWCPLSAIHHWGRKSSVKYHHPDIKLSDMFNNAGKVKDKI